MSNPNNITWMCATKTAAERFINEYYPSEAEVFGMFWDTFKTMLQDKAFQGTNNWPSPEAAHDLATSVNFAQSYAVNMASPIVVMAFAEIMSILNSELLSGQRLQDRIIEIAAKYNAPPSLTATLIKHLPAMCYEILEGGDSSITTSPEPQYQIWTGGQCEIVADIAKYEQHKDKYLIWIDLNAKTHISRHNPKCKLTSRPIELLIYLVERLGTPTPISEVVADVFENAIDTEDINNIQQNLTAVHKFCGGQFHQYVFAKPAQYGLGIDREFADKYFIFRRTR